MPKIDSTTPSGLTYSQVQKRLGMTRHSLHRAGLSEFLLYHQVGRSRLYLAEDVNKMAYWFLCQRGLAALGLIPPSPPAPLLPPGATYEERRARFDAWFEEDPNGVACPVCKGNAVQALLGGPIWCPDCGILE